MKRMLWSGCYAALCALTWSSARAYALPLRIDQQTIQKAQQDALFTADYDFEGILGLSGCSGSLVRYEDSDASDPAMVLTNGHCVKMISPNTAIVNQSARRTFSVLDPDGKRLGKVSASKLIYATMTGTDMALYLLKESYADIAFDFDVEALTLSSQYVEIGDAIEVISGYWRRGYSCTAEAIVHSLKEGNWLMKESIRYSRPGCDVIGGTSGSPVLLAGTRTVIGVNNTTNENGRECTLNNPCEIDENGEIFYEKGYGYAQQISWIYSCRSTQGDIDLNQADCRLFRNSGLKP